MDSEYLERVVGTALQDGLTQLAQKQPDDPVEWLAQWLLKYADDRDAIKRMREEELLLAKQREEYLREQEQRRLMLLEQERIRAQQEAERIRKEEEARQARQIALLHAYEELKEKNEAELLARRKKVDDKEVPLSSVELGKLRMNFVKDELKKLDDSHQLFEVVKTFTMEAQRSMMQIVMGVLYLVGYSKRTVGDLAQLKKTLESKATPTLLERMFHVKPQRGLGVSVLQRMRTATKGADVAEIVNPKIGNFAVFVLYEWLRYAVDLRNSYVEAKIQDGDRLESGEDTVFRVAEPGQRDAVPDSDEQSDLWDGAAASDVSYDEEGGDNDDEKSSIEGSEAGRMSRSGSDARESPFSADESSQDD